MAKKHSKHSNALLHDSKRKHKIGTSTPHPMAPDPSSMLDGSEHPPFPSPDMGSPGPMGSGGGGPPAPGGGGDGGPSY